MMVSALSLSLSLSLSLFNQKKKKHPESADVLQSSSLSYGIVRMKKNLIICSLYQRAIC